MNEAKMNLKKFFGYDSFRIGQEEIISRVLSGKSAAGIMPTGGGKSICYQIPALMFPGITLVISPLISLMKDQVDALNQNGIEAAYLNSSISTAEAEERMEDMALGRYKLVYIAPERLDNPYFLKKLVGLPVSLVAIDEAHCISQWGHDFRPSYMKIHSLIAQIETEPPVLALTATATPQVREDICRQLGITDQNVITTGFARDNLTFSVIKDENRVQFISRFVEQNKMEAGIIYTATRKETDNLYSKLVKGGYRAGRYHAGMNEKERAEQQELFLRDELSIMVATSAFGMGIDKSNVRYVIHYQMPKNMESYYQEAGRAGRDGLDSECVLLYSPQDLRVQRFLIEQSHPSEEHMRQELRKLNAMKDYCFTEGCLQTYILKYFGEVNYEDCGRCANCLDSRESSDVTVEAQKVLSCIVRMGERFGKTLVAQVLTGSNNRKMDDFGFKKLSTYGIMKEWTAASAGDFIDFLTARHYISLSDGQFPVLKVTEEGKAVLLGKERVMRKEAVKIRTLSQDGGLFEQLRQLRKQLAQEENVPPFVIFSDAALKDMAVLQPETEEQFLEVKGAGAKKQMKYGSRFLACIAEYKQSSSTTVNLERETSDSKEEPSHLTTFAYFQQGLGMKEMAEKRGLSIITIENHLLKCAEEGIDLPWDRILTEEVEEAILMAADRIGAGRLKPLKEELPKSISYFQIKAALLKRSFAVIDK